MSCGQLVGNFPGLGQTVGRSSPIVLATLAQQVARATFAQSGEARRTCGGAAHVRALVPILRRHLQCRDPPPRPAPAPSVPRFASPLTARGTARATSPASTPA